MEDTNKPNPTTKPKTKKAPLRTSTNNVTKRMEVKKPIIGKILLKKKKEKFKRKMLQNQKIQKAHQKNL